MAGYNYKKGMSNNAVFAYDEGKMALSHVTRKVLDSFDISIPVWFAKKLLQRKVGPCEWHHCGGKSFYNEIDFYDLSDLKNYLESNPDDSILELKEKWKESKKQKNQKSIRPVYGYWQVWKGKRRKELSGHTTFYGIKSGNWITLPDGKRKKANGNGLWWAPFNEMSLEKNPPLRLPKGSKDYTACDMTEIRKVVKEKKK